MRPAGTAASAARNSYRSFSKSWPANGAKLTRACRQMSSFVKPMTAPVMSVESLDATNCSVPSRRWTYTRK